MPTQFLPPLVCAKGHTPFKCPCRRPTFRPLVLLAAMLVSLPALAQDVPAPSTPALSGIASPDANPMALVAAVVELANQGKWLPAVMLALFGAVWAFRRFGLKLVPGPAGEWLRSKWGGWAINFTLALLGGFGSLALVGGAVTVGSVVGVVSGAVTFALGGAGLNELLKDLKPPVPEAPKVETLPEAVDVLNGKGPQP